MNNIRNLRLGFQGFEVYVAAMGINRKLPNNALPTGLMGMKSAELEWD